ncbi:MAG: VacJ family lipoprotein [Syntrophobacterales bacterium]|jgi:phospholipid-binding lipoprotein MlaA|nr:VacJ family lipoprotein [Syntrophobacterales bacterium]
MKRIDQAALRKKVHHHLAAACFIVMVVICSWSCHVHGAEDPSAQVPGIADLPQAARNAGEGKPDSQPGNVKPYDGYGNVQEQNVSEKPCAMKEGGVCKSSDEYGDVDEEELKGKTLDEYGNVAEGQETGDEVQIYDPIEPWNRAMYHFNDKLYFWALKPIAKGYGYILPEDIRALVGNFYQNIKAPIRIVNNLLQGKPGDAGREFTRLLINSTVGVAGLRDCAKECFGITGREADFGQTLGRYGLGFGIYIVWPFIGPSSIRDSAGFAGDWLLTPTTYVIWPSSARDELINPLSVILFTHNKVNYTSFHIGDYEALKMAAIDPYVAMRDFYAQYRKNMTKE